MPLFIHSLYCMYLSSCFLFLGNYGKLGHGDTSTQKAPKIISTFAGKVCTYSLKEY